MKQRITHKRIIWGLLAAYGAYLVVGLALTYVGLIPKLYFLPGWAIKPPHHDQSTIAADGPVVTYDQDRLIARQIHPDQHGVRLTVDTLTTPFDRSSTCFVGETGQSFSFRLHPLPAAEPCTYPQPQQMLVLSDIEGNFNGLQLVLRKAGVIDQHLAWQFGAGHLVFVGDMFDRGLQVTECLWLLYKLDEEAQRAGGKVHFILGNHEQLNLTGHYKYVRRKYRHNADTLRLPYSSWYGPDTELGRWLRSRNIIERIGNTLFVHGGISPQLSAQRAALPLLNQLARQGLDTTGRTPDNRPVAALVGPANVASPTWYRGLATEEAPPATVTRVLTTYGATRLVIGHTPVEDITPLYNNRVIAIDMPHQTNISKGIMKALWVERGTFYRFDTQHGLQPLFD